MNSITNIGRFRARDPKLRSKTQTFQITPAGAHIIVFQIAGAADIPVHVFDVETGETLELSWGQMELSTNIYEMVREVGDRCRLDPESSIHARSRFYSVYERLGEWRDRVMLLSALSGMSRDRIAKDEIVIVTDYSYEGDDDCDFPDDGC